MSTAALHDASNKPLDIAWVREQFPSLKLQVNGHAAAFLDGPGTQVPRRVMDAVQNYFLGANANTGGAFETAAAMTQPSTQAAPPWPISFTVTKTKSSSART